MTKKPKIIEDMYDLRMKIFFEFENECFCLILEMFKKILELQKKMYRIYYTLISMRYLNYLNILYEINIKCI